MKNYTKFVLFLFLLLFHSMDLRAQILVDEDFEGFPLQAYLCANSPDWTTWSGVTGGLEDIRITTGVSNVNNKNINIKGNPSFPQGGPSDILLKLGNKTTGVYSVAFEIYLNEIDNAYYGFQHFEQPGIEWAFGVYMSGGVGNGTAFIKVEAQGQEQFSNLMDRNQWVRLKHIFNLDTDQVTLFVNMLEVGTWPISWQEASSAPGTKQLGALNFFPIDLAYNYYIDNVVFEETEAVSTSSIQANSIKVFPNPAEDYLIFDLNLLSDSQINTFDLVIYDMAGKAVLSQNQAQVNEKITIADLDTGLYTFKLTTEDKVFTGRVVKE